MISTGNNMQSTGFQSPPGPPSRRLPSVASGERLYDDYSIFYSKTRAGSSLTEPHFGPDNGVHLNYPLLSLEFHHQNLDLGVLLY